MRAEIDPSFLFPPAGHLLAGPWLQILAGYWPPHVMELCKALI